MTNMIEREKQQNNKQNNKFKLRKCKNHEKTKQKTATKVFFIFFDKSVRIKKSETNKYNFFFIFYKSVYV